MSKTESRLTRHAVYCYLWNLRRLYANKANRAQRIDLWLTTY